MFDDNDKLYIIRIDNICITSSIYLENILFINDLKYNLLSINQFYDKDFKITFESLMHIISSSNDEGIMLIGYRHSNIYMVDLDDLSMENSQCLIVIDDKVNETS